MIILVFLFSLLICSLSCLEHDGHSYAKTPSIKYYISDSTRFLIFDVNPGEGFNLRRDVYGRAANVVNELRNKGEDWILVVPPWRHLYHWKTRYLQQQALPWHIFFDLVNMNHYIPVMEFHEFLKHTDEPSIIEEVVYLQRHSDNYRTGYKELIEENVQCEETFKHYYRKEPNSDFYQGHFWGMRHIRAKKVSCLGVQGSALVLIDYLLKTKSRVVFAERFEQLLHVNYGSAEYYKPRRSLVFAKRLREEGDKFRNEFLDSNDTHDRTPYNDEDWRKQIPKSEKAIGGLYVAVHMRRGDFAMSRKNTIPSFEEIGTEVDRLLEKYLLEKVYVSTDGTEEEVAELQSHIKLGKIYQYPRTKENVEKYKDGGIAIIDQWIVAHGRYFLGTCESTFSFRIQEERDILGLPEKTTFNCLCGKQSPPDTCHGPSKWRVKF